MKKLILFFGGNRYPNGGAFDIVGLFDCVENALQEKDRLISECKKTSPYCVNDTLIYYTDEGDIWWHVLDLESKTIVAHDSNWEVDYVPEFLWAKE